MTRVLYRDRQGNPISSEEMTRLYADPDSRRVGQDRIGPLLVSTVHLVMDHQFDPDGPPLIFETMIFGDDDHEPCWRYSTEAEARAAHESIVAQIRFGRSLEDVNP